jgi:hypothetical protein
MSQTRWSIENGQIKVTIEGPSSQARGKDLLTAAILAMINAADVEHWEKERLELGVTDDVTPADQFYSSVLTAVARHYLATTPVPVDAGPANEVLAQLMRSLVEKGRLRIVLQPWDDEPLDGAE